MKLSCAVIWLGLALIGQRAEGAVNPNCKIIKVRHVFDGERIWPLETKYLVVKGLVFDAILTEVQSQKSYVNCRAVDLTKLFVAPGLIDMHTHLFLTDTHFGKDLSKAMAGLIKWPRDKRMAFAQKTQLEYLRSGFTTLRDLGNSGRFLDAALKRTNLSTIAPEFLFSGPGWAVNHAQFSAQEAGVDPSVEYQIISASSDIERFMQEYKQQGADWIKIYLDNDPGTGTMPVSLARRIVSLAHANGLKVAAHGATVDSAKLAAQVGVDTLEHGYALTEEVLLSLKKSGVALIPTDLTADQCTQIKLGKGDPSMNSCSAYLRSRRDRLLKAFKMGVTVAFGSDIYYPFKHPFGDRGSAALAALRGWIDQGVDWTVVLKAATSTPAQILGLHNEGKIAPGFHANLVGFIEGPSKTTSKPWNVAYVMLRGSQNLVNSPDL